MKVRVHYSYDRCEKLDVSGYIELSNITSIPAHTLTAVTNGGIPVSKIKWDIAINRCYYI